MAKLQDTVNDTNKVSQYFVRVVVALLRLAGVIVVTLAWHRGRPGIRFVCEVGEMRFSIPSRKFETETNGVIT